ncbi:ATP-binding protein [Mycobacterium sp. OTB74]|uniref:ATP-binding protein n=1 Tax=Mycobacterium sp. OTB74 TaxID=1853452 RepID=UPI0024753A33|nr:ATP-binding protein [Mycobacterium sp. OTB74]
MRSRPATTAHPPRDLLGIEKPDQSAGVAIFESYVDAASQRHLLRRAGTVGLLMRHTVNVGVAAIALTQLSTGMRPGGAALMFATIGWSLHRLVRRSQSPVPTAIDVCGTLAICLGIPLLTSDPGFYWTNSVPQAVAGTAVIGFAVSLPMRISLPVTAAIAASYAVGLSGVIGWAHVGSVLAVYYFGLQWLTSSLIRFMLLRIAAAADRAREVREAAEADRQIDAAVRAFEREQLALLHDTAASTLLMVGQGVMVSPQRLAAQARRDLTLLDEKPWQPAPQRTELVSVLRDAVAHVRTPVRFGGRDRVWVPGEIGQAVVASAREALNNVDRHANATTACIEVAADRVIVSDDGTGFDTTVARTGHGIANSMTERMERFGGGAVVVSAPGAGTRVELCWFDRVPEPDAPAHIDPDRFIERVRLIYASVIAAYAVVNLLTTVPYAVGSTGAPGVQIALALVAAVCPLVAVPALWTGARIPVWFLLAAALAVVLVQPTLLGEQKLGTQVDWVQAGIGWCVFPLALTMSVRRAAGVLIWFWVVGGFIEVVVNPVTASVANVGLGTASILGVQLFALAFDGLMREAGREVHAVVEANKKLVVDARVARAVADDYQRRYASLVDNVIPLLRELCLGGPVSSVLQRRARIESRRLRALFDQSKTFAHPLLRCVRSTVDDAEACGIDVTVDVSGELPDIDEVAVNDLVGPLQRLMRVPMAAAHVVVSATGDVVSLSVVCRGIADTDAVVDQIFCGTRAELVTMDETVWLIVEHQSDYDKVVSNP